MSATLQEPPGGRQNKGTSFLVIALTCTIIASIVVALRVYIRVWVKRTYGWDDGFIVASLVYDPLRSTMFNQADSC